MGIVFRNVRKLLISMLVIGSFEPPAISRTFSTNWAYIFDNISSYSIHN